MAFLNRFRPAAFLSTLLLAASLPALSAASATPTKVDPPKPVTQTSLCTARGMASVKTAKPFVLKGILKRGTKRYNLKLSYTPGYCVHKQSSSDAGLRGGHTFSVTITGAPRDLTETELDTVFPGSVVYSNAWMLTNAAGKIVAMQTDAYNSGYGSIGKPGRTSNGTPVQTAGNPGPRGPWVVLHQPDTLSNIWCVAEELDATKKLPVTAVLESVADCPVKIALGTVNLPKGSYVLTWTARLENGQAETGRYRLRVKN